VGRRGSQKARQRRHIPGVAEAREPRRLASRESVCERKRARARERDFDQPLSLVMANQGQRA
jgi:hypothetical protein